MWKEARSWAQALLFLVQSPSRARAAVLAEARWDGYLRPLDRAAVEAKARRVLLETGADEVRIIRCTPARRAQLEAEAKAASAKEAE